MLQNDKTTDKKSKAHDGWRRIPTVLKEYEEDYNFDAAIADDANCHRLEEGRPWKERPRTSSSKKDGQSLSASTNRTSDDKVTFQASGGSSKNKALESHQKNNYRVLKYVEAVNTSKWPGWRWANFYYRTLAW